MCECGRAGVVWCARVPFGAARVDGAEDDNPKTEMEEHDGYG